jgi:aspartate-semialdehyde dehydrogenase
MRGFRVGVVRPGSPFGQRVRELLGEGELPVTELKLFESDLEGSATLTQFGDEVVVTQPLDVDLLPHLDVLFVAGGESDLINRTARETAEQGVLTLVEGAIGLDGPVVTPDRGGDWRSGRERLLNVPRVASYLIAETLRPLAESSKVERAVATVLVPAQSLGDRGVEELHQQVLHILNFKTPPTDVFHEQLAFNVQLAGTTAETSAAMAEAVAREASSLCGFDSVLAVNLVQIPVFHGYTASIWVELEDPLEAKEVSARFRRAPFESARAARTARAPSPVGIAGSSKIHLAPVRKGRSTGPRGFWIWAVADTAIYHPAEAAVEIAKELLG